MAPGSQSGFSLIDMLSGLVIAVLLVSSALTGVAQHQAQRRNHGERILAMSACRNTIETLRSLDIATLATYDGRGFDVPGQNGQAGGLNPIDGDADGLAGEISVVEHARSTPTNLLYIVTARIRWQGATRGGDFAMQTLMGERR